MQNPFYTIVQQVCGNRWCSLHNQPVDLGAPRKCVECGGALTRTLRFETARAFRALAVLMVVGGGILLFWKLDTIVGPLLKNSQKASFDSTSRTELTSLLRSAYRDEEVTVEERAAIERVVSHRKLQPGDVEKLEQEIRPRVIAATRSLTAAKGYIDARRLDDAVREYRHATRIDPEDSLAWAGLAAAYFLQGKAKDAEEAYRQALTLDPDNWLANYNLGLAAERRGESEVALEYFQRAVGSLRANGPERHALVAELKTAPELGTLRRDPRFISLLDQR